MPKMFHLMYWKYQQLLLVLRTREITDIVNTFDEIYLLFTSKK